MTVELLWRSWYSARFQVEAASYLSGNTGTKKEATSLLLAAWC
jgi:hypothetical protein